MQIALQTSAADPPRVESRSSRGARFVGVVEFQFTGTNGVLDTHVVRAVLKTTNDLPGNLAAVSGRLLRRFAAEGLAFVASEQKGMK